MGLGATAAIFGAVSAALVPSADEAAAEIAHRVEHSRPRRGL
jgi:hypothetical protein